VGRFFAVDPLAWRYSYNSPYSFSENQIINAVELEGLEKKVIIHRQLYEPVLDTWSAGEVKMNYAEYLKSLGSKPSSKSKAGDRFGPRGGGTLHVYEFSSPESPMEIWGIERVYEADAWDKWYKLWYNEGYSEMARRKEMYDYFMQANDWEKEGFENWKNEQGGGSEKTTLPVNQYSEEELYWLYTMEYPLSEGDGGLNGTQTLTHENGITGTVKLSALPSGSAFILPFYCLDGCHYRPEYAIKTKNGYSTFEKDQLTTLGYDVENLPEVLLDNNKIVK
jgi:hypothetical protein